MSGSPLRLLRCNMVTLLVTDELFNLRIRPPERTQRKDTARPVSRVRTAALYAVARVHEQLLSSPVLPLPRLTPPSRLASRSLAAPAAAATRERSIRLPSTSCIRLSC